MTRKEAIELIDDRMCWGRGKWSKHHMPEIDEYWQAGLMAIEALKAQIDKDIDVPSNDVISRQAAIEWCLEGLNNMPSAQPEPMWISCSERLPEDEIAYYLVTLVNHGLLTYGDIDIARWDYDRRKGKESWHWCKEREVIAWMPLPEPYKGGELE